MERNTRTKPKLPNDNISDEAKTVNIRTFSSHESAELAVAKLEVHGVACWVKTDDGGGMLPNLTAAVGVRLLVHSSDAEAATAILNSQYLGS